MLVLASGSPRRAALLRQAGIPFEARVPEVDERHAGPPRVAAAAIARRKALAVDAPGAWRLGADTIVALDGTAIGKPADATDARRILGLLAGREHEVTTGVAVVDPGGRVFEGSETARVRFVALSPEAIDAYVATGEIWGKAGAYAMQGRAEAFVERLEGTWSCVVGLPLATTVRVLAESGFPLPPHVAVAKRS